MKRVAALPKKKFLIILTVLGMAVLGVASFIHCLNSPAYGTIIVNRTIEEPLTDSTHYSTLNNDYFSLLYPSDLTPDFPQTKPGGTLTYNFLSKQAADDKLSDSLEVYVKPLPHGGVVLDSDYRSYTSQTKLYKLSQKFIRAETVDVASRDSGLHERVAIWAHGSNIMILKLKSTAKDDLDTKFSTILKSVGWIKS